jgi:hypothetical protein
MEMTYVKIEQIILWTGSDLYTKFKEVIKMIVMIPNFTFCKFNSLLRMVYTVGISSHICHKCHVECDAFRPDSISVSNRLLF